MGGGNSHMGGGGGSTVTSVSDHNGGTIDLSDSPLKYGG